MALTTDGWIDVHKLIETAGRFFSFACGLHPSLHQSLCKAEAGSANDLSSHDKCVDDINEVSNTNLQFPIIADADLKGIAFTIRSVLVSRIFLEGLMTMMYPASTGRNSTEVLRVIDSLQSGDKEGVVTPIDWQVGEDVIVPPSVSTEDAKKKFGDVREVKPYLRFTKA
ncbi:thioredoxin-like protein [Fusarium oxysporum f. sp. albedinis]|nr:thioredoxin-like protein [Fusarium oxysporum f. sp. albedinis]KAK2477378.1 hypothetical protein H9L39_09866 [Fusarium oxysporum f. sp. albedinis]